VAKSKATESGNITRHKLRFNLILFAVLFIVVLALFHVFIFSDKMLDSSDQIQAGVFFRSFYVDYVAEHGAVPVWNPYQFCGIPYIDGFHGDTFYPFSTIKFFMNAYRALGWNMLLHVFIAGITMFFCVRAFGRSQMASVLSAVSYMFAAYFVSQVAPGHDGKMFVTSLFPLTIMLIELAFRKRALLNFSMLGLVIGVIILTPHPQMAYYTLWACAFYMAFKLIFEYVDNRSVPALVKPTGLFVWAVVIGLAISAIHFYPGYLYIQNHSPRADEKRGEDWARSWSLHWEETASLVVPEFCGVKSEEGNSYWGKNPFKDNSEYAGAVPLLMALVAIIMVRSRKTWFFGALALFAIIYGLSGNTPFFYLFFHLIPNVKSTRAWSMIMFLFSFSIALLAAFGLDFVIEQSRKLKDQRRRAFNMALFGLPAIVFLGALFYAAAPDAAIGVYKSIFYSNVDPQKGQILRQHLGTITTGFWVTSFFLIASAVAAWLYSRRKAAVLILWVVIAASLVDAYRFDLKFIRLFDQENPQPHLTFKSSPLVDFFKSVPGKFRVLDLSGGFLKTNYLPLHGIEEMTSYHGSQPRWYHSLLGGTAMRNLISPNLWRMTNTRYLVISPGSPFKRERLLQSGLPEVVRWQNLSVFEIPTYLDRAYIVHEWVIDSNEDNVRQMVLASTFNPYKQVGLTHDPGITMVADSILTAEDKATIEQYENNYINIRTTSEADGILVLSDNWYPAWKAFLDGQEVEVMRANGAFRGIVLPSGEHTVEFKYISSSQSTGRWLTFAGLLAVAAGIVGSVIPRRRKSNSETEENDE
jgi:hypothetical protein